MNYIILIFLLFSLLRASCQTINDTFEEGLKLKESKKFNEAITKFSEVIKKDKYYHEAWYHR
ncbi:MAG: hypothetical protein N2449_05445, partial [Bacteroidales bacterium]|nr:hypothetical protein [Bacteroidales bacterium]